MPAQRWSAAGVRHTGWGNIAILRDRQESRERALYFRLGRWRFYANDTPAPRSAAAVARRLLRSKP